MGWISDARVMKEFGAAVKRLNARRAPAPLGAEGERTVKDRIAAGYDLWAPATAYPIWNWGMNDDALREEMHARAGADAFEGPDDYSQQLYFFVAKEAKLTAESTAKVLEVGCGLGGGLWFLSKTCPRAELTGLDLSRAAVERANARGSNGSALRYVVGDAESIPFDDGAFDVVLNVESSHNYPRLGKFFSEVSRVLRSGGVFSMVDFFSKERRAEAVEAMAATGGLRWTMDQDISDRVKAAIRERVKPGSKFRMLESTTGSALKNALRQRMAMLVYGAEFAGHDFGVLDRAFLTVTGARPIPVESYRHALAVKP